MSYSTFKQLRMSPLEALQLFCEVISYGGGFHPEAFRSKLEEEKNCQTNDKRFFHKAYQIERVLDKAYIVAVNKHILLNPGGFLPKKIIFRKSIGRHALKWKTEHTVITLTFLRFETFLAVTSYSLYSTQKYALHAGLPTPTPDDHKVEATPTQTIWNVRIPLGDLIDFINRYRT